MDADYGQGEKTLSKAAEMVAAAKAEFDKDAKNLESQIQGLSSKWQGQGGAAFFKLQQAWNEKQTIVVRALNDFEASLQSTERDNINTDDTNSSSMNRLSGRLGGI